jgi:hypothetical protein
MGEDECLPTNITYVKLLKQQAVLLLCSFPTTAIG